MNDIMSRFLQRGRAPSPAPSLPPPPDSNSQLSEVKSEARGRMRQVQMANHRPSPSQTIPQSRADPIETFSDPDDNLPSAGHGPREPGRLTNDIRDLLGLKPLNRREKYPLYVHPSHHLSLIDALYHGERSNCPRSYSRTCLRSVYSRLLELPFTQRFPSTDGLDFVSSVEFDSKGSLMCAASSSGNVIVHDFDSLIMLWSSRRRLYEQGCSRLAALPVDERPPSMKSGLPRLDMDLLDSAVQRLKVPYRVDCMRFNPHNEDKIGMTGTTRGEVLLYDLASAQVNRQPAKWSASHNQAMTVLQFCKADKHVLVGGSVSGVISRWDLRVKSKTQLEMKPYRNIASPIRALSFDSSGLLLWQCRKDGVIAVTDMRKTRSSVNWGTGNFLKVIRSPTVGSTVFDAQFNLLSGSILTLLDDELNIAQLCLGSGEAIKKVQVNERRHRDENIGILSQIRRFQFSLFQDGFAALGGYLPTVSTVDLSTSQDLGLAIREQNLTRSRNGEAIELYPKQVCCQDKWSIVSKVNLDAHVAVTAAHPSLPYLVCGTTANQLRLLGLDFQKFDWGSLEEKKEEVSG